MSKVHRQLVVDREIHGVWDYVKDMGNWASQMPGYVSHETANADDSVWTLHVNFGPFARPVVVDVHVTRWLAPTEVHFEVKGRSDPFVGGGSFVATAGAGGTAITLEFGAEGTGSMAKMITAMVPPVLEYMGDGFAANLARELQERVPLQAQQAAPEGLLQRCWRHLVNLLGAAFRRGGPGHARH